MADLLRLQPVIIEHLKTLFEEVRHAACTGRGNVFGETGVNPKGDQVRPFDLAADQAVVEYLETHFPCPVRLLSEEGPPRIFGKGEAAFTLVLDPVDGSDNFARGIGPAAMAVALIPAGLPIAVQTVAYALVGDLFTGHTWLAVREGGATRNGQPIHTREVSQLAEAMISCELNHFAPPAPLSRLLARARGVRTFGCASRALSLLAEGALDAHLDLRGRLTPENFLAPALVLTEAGGVLTNPAGHALPQIRSLIERYSILAAATPLLHMALVQQLEGDPGAPQP